MTVQKEITVPTSIYGEGGKVNAGWCRRNLFVYDRNAVPKKLRMRTKEWDFFQVSDGEQMLQITFANISLGAAATCSYVNLKNGERLEIAELVLFSYSKYPLEPNADVESSFHFAKGRSRLDIVTTKTERKLYFEGYHNNKKVIASCSMTIQEGLESITICTPFKLPHRFFLTQKQNCMPTQASILIGDRLIQFNPTCTYGVMDWGRGVWPHKNEWYWGNGTTLLDGKLFGFELTWGFGDESAATETCLFYDGKAHKIGRVKLKEFPGEKGYMEPWEFSDEEGRFTMTMTPFFDNHTGAIPLGLLGMETHQVHGLWSGRVVLDDGTPLEIKDMYAFCEYVRNAW